MSVTIILGAQSDYHAHHMLNASREAGMDAVLFDTSSFPDHSLLSWQPDKQNGCIKIHGRTISFEDINSVFWSTAGQSHGDLQHLEFNKAIALNDTTSMLKTFFMDSNIYWCNSWQAIQFHKVKPRQLALASRLGLTIPATYMGNDCQQLKAFVGRHKQTIFKPVFGGAHCAKVHSDHLSNQHLDKVLRVSPVTIQQYIPGTNVRTFVIGNQVFSAQISSDAIDFRTDSELEINAIDLPRPLAAKAIELTRAFCMNWTAIDWRRTKSGEYFFLEANPSPMFIHFEQSTGFPITDALTLLLSNSTAL